MSKVLVHENFTNAVNDIALLKLGKIKIHLAIPFNDYSAINLI